ncbi:MAG: glucarate dehydratase [Phycisphaerales bacterium]|jgi:glucarate dehydratase|nr:glucarate dehydratase [Phycisphaerales bacterium]
MPLSRRDCLKLIPSAAAVIAASNTPIALLAGEAAAAKTKDLTIKELRFTPVAIPDPPILSAAGCHGPYFLRTIIEVVTSDGITGVGETRGGDAMLGELNRASKKLIGQSALNYRKITSSADELTRRALGGIEVACLDAIGRATGMRVCELFGGPVREDPEFASYLFYKYAADHPALLADKRIVDNRGKLDEWGEVRTPEAMAELAYQFQKKYGFRVSKLKGGVLAPEAELETLRQISARLGKDHLLRIDPNSVWNVETALTIGEQLKTLPLEYYEDPVDGFEKMAEVRSKTGLKMASNMFVKSFDDIGPAVKTAGGQPFDVVLIDHLDWGGIANCSALGPIAHALKWPLSQHSNSHCGVSMAAMIHAAALIPELTLASDTHYPWLPDNADIIAGEKLPIVNGRMKVPAGPGLGVELDRDMLAKAHETYEKCGMRKRDDAFTMQLIEPGWKPKIVW